MKSTLPATRLLALVAAIIAGAALLAGCSGSTEGLLGQELYNKSCELCHGADGRRGTQIGAGSPAVELSDEQLRGAIAVGPGTMPGFPRFSQEQLDSLVAHIRDLQAGNAGDG